jgi:Ger(x)C family germination protein/spore germination protein (amino acid permease)
MTTIISGVTIIELPAKIAEVFDTGGWMSLVISALIILLPLAAWAGLSAKFPGATFVDYAPKIVGKLLAKLTIIFYSLCFIVYLAFMSRIFAEFIREEYLPRTPIWVILLVLLAVCTYAARKGIVNIARIVEFLGICVLLAVVVTHLSMLFIGDTLNIRPLFESVDAPSYLAGLPMVLPIFAGIAILNIVPLDSRKLGRWCIGTAAICATLLILVTISVFSILGVSEVRTYANVLFVAIRETRAANLQIMSRMDVIFIAFWLLAVFSSATLFKYAIDVNLTAVFRRPARNIPRTTAITSAILVFALALIPPDRINAVAMFDRFLWIFGAITAAIIPIFYYIIAGFRPRAYACAAVLILSLSLTGCWDAQDIQAKNIAVTVMADKTDEGYELRIETARTTGSGQGEVKNENSFLTGMGSTIEVAQDNLNQSADNPIYPNSTRVLLLGKGLARTGVEATLNRLRGDDQYRKNVYIFTTSLDNLSDLADLEPNNNTYIGAAIENDMNSSVNGGRDFSVSAQDLLRSISAGNPHFLLPVVGKHGDQAEIGSYAIFRRCAQVGAISDVEKNGLLFLKSNNATAIYSEKIGENEFFFEVNLKNREVNFYLSNGKATCDILLNLNAELLYSNQFQKLTQSDLDSLLIALKQDVSGDVMLEIRRAQDEYGCDYLGFWQNFRAKFGKLYETLNWEETYKNAEFRVETRMKLSEGAQ